MLKRPHQDGDWQRIQPGEAVHLLRGVPPTPRQCGHSLPLHLAHPDYSPHHATGRPKEAKPLIIVHSANTVK